MNFDDEYNTSAVANSTTIDFSFSQPSSTVSYLEEKKLITSSISAVSSENVYDAFDIKKVARLSNLLLNTEEENLYRIQLTRILQYLENLREADTSSVEPTFNVSGKENVLREDIAQTGLTQEEAVSNASVKRDGFFVSRGVFKNE